MAETVLIQAQPFNPANGAAVVVRLAGGGTKPYTQFGTYDWRAGITTRPRFAAAIAFDQTGFTGSVVPQTATVRFYPNAVATLTAIGNLNWIQAPITIYVGDDEALSPSYPVAFSGTVASVQTDGGSIAFTISDLSVLLDKPAAPDTFGGTGDLDAGSDAVGRVKRRSFGYVFNIEGRLLDVANNIYEFSDPNRPIQSFIQVRDKGRAGVTPTTIAWQGSALATLNALRSATVPSGGAAVAPSIACVKWWTVPTGPLTADLQGEIGANYVQTAPEIASYMVGLYAPSIAVTMPPSALAWQSAVAGVHVDTATETVGNVLDRLLLPVSTVWTITPTGQLAFSQVTFNNPIASLTAQTIVRDTVFQPLRTRRIGFQRNYRVQSASEISSTLLLATDATYADGTAIEVLKPAQANADKTASNTAAAISGQGAFATISTAGYGSSYLTGFGTLAPRSSIAFNTSFLLTSAGAQATDSSYQTALGTAAAITGQSPFATYTGTTPGALLAPSANMIVDSTFRFYGLGWTFGAGFSANVTAFDSNAFLYNAGNNGTAIATSPRIVAAANVAYCLQGELQYFGTSNSISADVAWTDSSGNVTYSSRIQIGPSGVIAGTDISGRQSNYYSLYASLVSPANTVSAVVRCYTESGNGSCYWRRLKLAVGSKPTIWSDEASTSARYASDGTLLDNLRPATVAADKTGNATAAAIAGQAATATSSDFSAVTGTTKPANNADVTSANTALAIAGQGALATKSSVGSTDLQMNATYQASQVVNQQNGEIDAGGSGDSDHVRVTSNGGLFRIDLQLDAARTGGTGSATVQILATPQGGSESGLSRQAQLPQTTFTTPVTLWVTANYTAGTVVDFYFRVTTSNPNGKPNSWSYGGGTLLVVEFKR